MSRTNPDANGVDVIADAGGNVFDGYGACDGTFYLLRPDRHVAARWRWLDTAEIELALRAALGGGRQ